MQDNVWPMLITYRKQMIPNTYILMLVFGLSLFCNVSLPDMVLNCWNKVTIHKKNWNKNYIRKIQACKHYQALKEYIAFWTGNSNMNLNNVWTSKILAVQNEYGDLSKS